MQLSYLIMNASIMCSCNPRVQSSVSPLFFYSAVALLAKVAIQSAVLAMAFQPVCPSVCYMLVPYPDE